MKNAASKSTAIDAQTPVQHSPIAETESATDKVADAITQGIRTGIFVPGQHLLEPDLTRRLGISRGSLRESLKHLAAAGIVTLNRYRGAYIGLLDRTASLQLLDTLEPLARLAARLAAEKCTNEAARAKIEQAIANLERAARSGNRAHYLDSRRAFYDAMIDLGGNRELARVIPLSRTDLFRAQIETVQSDTQRKRHASGYGPIAKAIIAADPKKADLAVKKHFEGTRKTMTELPEDIFPITN